jgi:hypothetical protein
MSEEKRKNPRYESLNLSYVCEDEQGVVLHEGMGRTLNISETGILLETTCEHSADNTLTLEIALEDDLISLRGKVVHCRQAEQGLYNTGVEFTALDEKDLTLLKQFITLFESKKS